MQADKLSEKILDIVNNVSDEKFVFVQDMHTGITTWSQEAVDYLNLPGVNLRETTSIFGALVHPDDFPKWIQELNDVFSYKKEDFFCTYNIKNAKGAYVPCIGKGRMVYDEDGRAEVFAGTITIQKREVELDALTDLPKLQEFIEDIRQARKQNECLAMAVELRHFHNVNTLYGYHFGNKALYAVAQRMKEMISGNGKVYRTEGTQFLFLIQNNDIEYVKKFYAGLRDALSVFELDGCSLNLEITGGALHTHNCMVSSQTILSCLLSALERAKDEESFELVVFDDETQETNYKMMEMLDAVKAAVRNGCEGFYLCYQPFVSTTTGKIIGAEALIRFRSPIYGEISPGRFVPHLESHPCFYDLSIWVLKKAIKDTKELLSENPKFFVNVNMSYSQLERESFKHEVVAILDEMEFPHGNLQLELTERCRNLDLDYLREQLQFFRGHGIKVALDDFGTGNSTINLLCELPISCVKIDQTFILNILEKANNQVVVNSTVECAKRLGLNICMEGVETHEIREFIGQYAASYHQGYFYSRPVEFERFKETLKESWAVSKVKLLRSSPKEMFGTDSILSMMPGGFFVYTDTPSENLVTVNETLLSIYGCESLDEFLQLTGSSFRGMVHPEDYPKISKSIKEQVERSDTGMDFVRYRIFTKDGTVKRVRDYGRLIPGRGDVDLYYVFLVEDRT